MNILVLSDSHGNISNMEEAVEREKPDVRRSRRKNCCF